MQASGVQSVQNGRSLRHGAHARPTPARALRCNAMGHQDSAAPSIRERAGLLLSGLAAGALALNANSAQAVEATATAPSKTAPPPPTTAATTKTAVQLQQELEKRSAADLESLTKALEASKQAAVKNVETLQKRVAAEHAAMLQLQAELRSAKAQLNDSQKEVEKEKGLLVAAKDAALAAKKEAADAAAAAHKAELALRGQAGMETLKSPLGLAAASGWTLAAIVALAKNKGGPNEIDWSKVEGKDEILAAMESARKDGEALRRESENLKRDLTTMQSTVSQLTKQLDAERNQRDTLRETILLLEREVGTMEQRMNAAKTEASTLKKKLEDVKVPTGSKRPTLNEILTGQAASESRAKSTSTSTSTSSTSSRSAGSSNGKSLFSGSSSYGSGNSVNGKYDTMGSSSRAVRVRFTLQKELPFGQSLKLVGSHPALGAWDESRGLNMTWGDGHRWIGEVPMPVGTAVEFKAVVAVEGGASQWEQGTNHVLLIPDSTTSSSLSVKVEWGAGTAVLDEAQAKKEMGMGKVLATAGAMGSSGSSGSSSNSGSSSSSKASASSKKWAGLLG